MYPTPVQAPKGKNKTFYQKETENQFQEKYSKYLDNSLAICCNNNIRTLETSQIIKDQREKSKTKIIMHDYIICISINVEWLEMTGM